MVYVGPTAQGALRLADCDSEVHTCLKFLRIRPVHSHPHSFSPRGCLYVQLHEQTDFARATCTYKAVFRTYNLHVQANVQG